MHLCTENAQNKTHPASPSLAEVTSFVMWLQATAQLREELQSKEKEHQLAVHTLRDQVTRARTHTDAPF